MLNGSLLSLRESSVFFGRGSEHLPVRLRYLPDARVVWINPRTMKDDPSFKDCGGTREAYVAHLLLCCAYALAESENHGPVVTGYADRYGGIGIGRNGGSGRAAMVHGYHVKGIGRTPLVSPLTDHGHASGGAYLEECVREAIFSELVAAEFPGGAVPILAIIDTGLTQVWQTDRGPMRERHCLIVRPAFLRPAHFERAAAFIGEHPKEGYRDALRVRQSFGAAIKLWGNDALRDTYRTFWLTWAEQLAYAFVHRLPHGGDNTSNIAMDGRLLDFGGMTAVPSWARISTVMGCAPSGENLRPLINAIQIHTAAWDRYVSAEDGRPGEASRLIGAAVQRYQQAVVREVLRVAGLTRPQTAHLLSSDQQRDVLSLVGRLLTHYRREHLTVFNGMPMPQPHFGWDVGQLWSETPPPHLQALRTFLADTFGMANSAEFSGSPMHAIAKRCVLRSRSRDALYRDVIKRDLYHALECDLRGDALCQESLDRLISRLVCQNRRDSPVELDDAVPIGFARNSTTGYALFRGLGTKRRFAIREWAADTGHENPSVQSPRIAIAQIAEGSIEFADAVVPTFKGALMSVA